MESKARQAGPVVVLVGARCSGKSSVGRAAAGLLGLPWFDTDAIIARAEGWSVADLIDRDGWESFRLRENRALEAARRHAAARGGGGSAGGGAVLSAANRALMRGSGFVMYLKAPPEILALRLCREGEKEKRPSLSGADPAEEMEAVLRERESLYRDAAGFLVDASPGVQVVARTVVEIVRSMGGRPGRGQGFGIA